MGTEPTTIHLLNIHSANLRLIDTDTGLQLVFPSQLPTTSLCWAPHFANYYSFFSYSKNN
jgi:hypothetical protein